MQEKIYFQEGLSRMWEIAARKSRRLTVADILSCFPDRQLTRREIALIYQYAQEKHVEIEDYRPHDTRSVSVTGGKARMTGEEKAYFKMYLEDLRRIPECSEDEREMLVTRLLDGDDSVANRLIEGSLRDVLEMARGQAGGGVPIGDLVQEGNMELMLAVSDLLSGQTQILAGGFRDYISGRVTRAMKAQIAEQTDQDRVGERLARETNQLLAAVMDLEDELGREATLAELAEKVHLPEDQVEELVRISLNAAACGDRQDEENQGNPMQ